MSCLFDEPRPGHQGRHLDRVPFNRAMPSPPSARCGSRRCPSPFPWVIRFPSLRPPSCNRFRASPHSCAWHARRPRRLVSRPSPGSSAFTIDRGRQERMSRDRENRWKTRARTATIKVEDWVLTVCSADGGASFVKNALLRSVFGHAEFRSGQEELIDALHSGRDLLGVMATGSGKSLCYQFPAVQREGAAWWCLRSSA